MFILVVGRSRRDGGSNAGTGRMSEEHRTSTTYIYIYIVYIV